MAAITTNASFTIERSYPNVSPARVYAAFANEEAKAKWFSGGGAWKLVGRAFDFREGGHEMLKGEWPNGMITHFECRYYDIIPNERIVYAYEMFVDGKRISVSLACVEIKDEGDATRLVITEQGTYFDDMKAVESRKHGTGILIDRLGGSLAN